MSSPRRRVSFDRRLLLLSLLSGLLAVALCLALLWTGSFSTPVRWLLSMVVVGWWLFFAFLVRERIVFPVRTVSNLLSALREGDYSIRARGAESKDAFGELMLEVNSLSALLRDQRLGALEAGALLRRVMAEIDVGIFTFDSSLHLKLVNRAGEKMLGLGAERMLGRTAEEIGLAGFLAGEAVTTVDLALPGAAGRYRVSRSTFREEGRPHTLLVLSDLSRELRDEERQAWQRIVRVIGHELNNSLAPIKSIAVSLGEILAVGPVPDEEIADLRRGLGVIASRADGLGRFMEGYARLARLPKPNLAPVRMGELIAAAVGMERRMRVEVVGGPDVTVSADRGQVEQLLINLLRNAVDAALETGGGVRLGWSSNGSSVRIVIEDEGPGIGNAGNLFVPFFTTKKEGSGIGLVLSRQIAEAHEGALSLANRTDKRGTVATVRLPM